MREEKTRHTTVSVTTDQQTKQYWSALFHSLTFSLVHFINLKALTLWLNSNRSKNKQGWVCSFLVMCLNFNNLFDSVLLVQQTCSIKLILQTLHLLSCSFEPLYVSSWWGPVLQLNSGTNSTRTVSSDRTRRRWSSNHYNTVLFLLSYKACSFTSRQSVGV